jgi:sugar O-acyltransferase (sialic acid O-acetyltransferase NeuD family)
MNRKPVVMFGDGKLARTLLYFLDHDSPFDVVAITVDREWMDAERVIDLPRVPFDEVAQHYPPETHDMFVALGYRGMNTLREARYTAAKAMGYELISHVSPRASVWPDLQIGDNCLVLDEVMVHPFVRIGCDTIIWSGSHVGHGSTIGDHCFIASRTAISGSVTVGDHCFLGTNSTVRDGLTIAPMTLVGAGAIVSTDTGEGQILAPSPTRILPGRSDRLPRF